MGAGTISLHIGNATANSIPIGGSYLAQQAALMNAGDFRTITTTNFGANGDILVPPIGMGSIIEYADKALWDSVRKRFYFIGAAHTYDSTNPLQIDFVQYDEATNTWTKLTSQLMDISLRMSMVSHAYNGWAYNPTEHQLYGGYYSGGNVSMFDFGTETWTTVWKNTGVNANIIPALCYFPDARSLIWYQENTAICAYNFLSPPGGAWPVLSTPGGPWAYSSFIHYSEVHHCVICGGGWTGGTPNYNVWRIDADLSVHALDPCSYYTGPGEDHSAAVIDPVTGNLLVYYGTSVGLHDVYELNPVASPGSQWAHKGTLESYGFLKNDYYASPVNEIITRTISCPTDQGVTMYTQFNGSSSRVFLHKHP